MTVVERKVNTEDLISFEEIAKKHTAGEYLAIGDNGKSYHASYVPKYEPSGVMFFCIPQSVEIWGYLEIVEVETATFGGLVQGCNLATDETSTQ